MIRYNQYWYVNICECVKINRISRNKIHDVLNWNINSHSHMLKIRLIQIQLYDIAR